MHSGGCHCGKVRFEVEVDLAEPITCNCSYCARRGSILAFTRASRFELVQGEGDLTEYRFNTNRIQHLFCAGCGMESFARADGPDGTPMVAINLRCLDGVEVDRLKTTQYDGRSH